MSKKKIRELTQDLKTTLINLDNQYPNGAFGSYVKLSNLFGIKINTACSPRRYQIGYRTPEALKKTGFYKKAVREARNMRTARNRLKNKSMVPICYGVTVVPVVYTVIKWVNYCEETYIVRSYMPAIIMEHISGDTLDNRYRDGDWELIDELRSLLYRRGINHMDCDAHNIMVRRKRPGKSKYVFIDWAPPFVKFERKPSKRRST
jgi:hypothetical protein